MLLVVYMRVVDWHVLDSRHLGLRDTQCTGQCAKVLPCCVAELGPGGDMPARSAALGGSDAAKGASLGGVMEGAQALSSLPMRIVDRGVERLG